ncbi:MAG: hypothetical protein ABF301_00640 [Sulfurovum sp.]|jgi:hypothetical protein|nr:MAG: Uncharacterised protein [Arcobacter lacus]
MKNSFSLLEVIFTTLISTIIFIASIYYLKDLVIFNQSTLNKETRNLDLLSTKIFLQKNNYELEKKLKVLDKKLLYENSVLLNDVLTINILKGKRYYEINLTTKKQNLVWIIKYD